MDNDKLKDLFEDKYESKLGLSFADWSATAPESEDEAYARCQYIDDELKATYDEWHQASGQEKETLEEYRDRLKLEYDIIEEMFGLELKDK